MNLTQAQLRSVLLDVGIDGRLNDEFYQLPTKESFLQCAAEMWDNMRKLGVIFAAESFDCDNWAMLMCALMHTTHVKNFWAKPCGLPVGMIPYRIQQSQLDHMIVVAVVNNNGTPEVVFVEPQNGEQRFLTDDERRLSEPIWM